MKRREPGTSRIYAMKQAYPHAQVLKGVNQELRYQRSPYTPSIETVFVDSGCRVGEIILGPCSTLGGPLCAGEAMVHPETAVALRALSPQHYLPDLIFKEPEPVSDIEHKTFAVKREEWFVPTGDYRDQHGACWTDFMLAITYATNRLIELGKFSTDQGEPSSDLIKVVPHDEHVVVRIEYTEEQK